MNQWQKNANETPGVYSLHSFSRLNYRLHWQQKIDQDLLHKAYLESLIE